DRRRSRSLAGRNPARSVGELSPVAEGGAQAVSEGRGELVVADVAERRNGFTELLQIVFAAVACSQVQVETGASLVVQCPVQIVGDELDELVAVHGPRAHDASA